MTMLLKIDSDVCIPSNVVRGKKVNPRTFTVLALKCGQSLFMQKLPNEKASYVSRLLSGSGAYAKKLHPDRKFLVRVVKENNQEGARIWRIK